jgi:hypothetical protein
MNIIAFDAVYALYPRATFGEWQNLVMRDDSNHDQLCLAKYASRGWRTAANYWPQDESLLQLFFIGKRRFVGDNMCWNMKFTLDGVDTRPLLSPTSDGFEWDPIRNNSWMLTLPPAQPWKAVMQYQLVKTAAYRFAYLCVPNGLRDVLIDFGK